MWPERATGADQGRPRATNCSVSDGINGHAATAGEGPDSQEPGIRFDPDGVLTLDHAPEFTI